MAPRSSAMPGPPQTSSAETPTPSPNSSQVFRQHPAYANSSPGPQHQQLTNLQQQQQSYDYYLDSGPPPTPHYGSVAAVAGSVTASGAATPLQIATPLNAGTPVPTTTPLQTPTPSHTPGPGQNNLLQGNAVGMPQMQHGNIYSQAYGRSGSPVLMGTSLGGPQSFDQQQQQQSSYDQEAFARSREMAQTDPDYARRGSASAQGSSGIDNKELFQPSLARKKLQQQQQIHTVQSSQRVSPANNPASLAVNGTVRSNNGFGDTSNKPYPPPQTVPQTQSQIPNQASTSYVSQQQLPSTIDQSNRQTMMTYPSTDAVPPPSSPRTRSRKSTANASHNNTSSGLTKSTSKPILMRKDNPALAAAVVVTAMTKGPDSTANQSGAVSPEYSRRDTRDRRSTTERPRAPAARRDEIPPNFSTPVSENQNPPPLAATSTPQPATLELLQKQADANRSARRHYNEGYKDRIKSLDKSPHFLGMPLDRAQTIHELQEIFQEISALEPKCQAALDPTFDHSQPQSRRGSSQSQDSSIQDDPMDDVQQPQRLGLETYTEDQWNDIAQEQIRLVELYCDFLYFASASIQDGEPHQNQSDSSPHDAQTTSSYSQTSTASKSLQNLVRKYKIPTRLWNLGISLFIDSLRDTRPQYTSVLGRFIMHCMSLLMIFVDPIYETRHVWIESLGDLAFVCLISDVKCCADWPSMCTYWYQQRLLLTPGTGRVYRHMASISDIKIDKLFYICKSFTTWQPSTADAKEVLQMLNFSKDQIIPVDELILSGRSHLSRSPNSNSPIVPQSIYVFCTLHLQCIGVLDFRRFHVGSEIKKAILSGVDPIIDHAATIALCNIAALLGHGAPDHPLFAMFQALYKRKRSRNTHTHNSDSTQSQSNEEGNENDMPFNAEYWAVPEEPSTDRILQIAMPRLLAYDILYTFISTTEWTIGLQHVLVWLYFFISLCESFPEVQPAYFNRFNSDLFVRYLNRIIEVVEKKEYYVNSVSSNSDVRFQSNDIRQRLSSPVAVFPEDELAKSIRTAKIKALEAMERAAQTAGGYPSQNLDQVTASARSVLVIEEPPPLIDRPLPEEYHIRGFIWSAGLARYSWLNCPDMAVPDEPYVAASGPKYLAEIRTKRIIRLAKDLAKVAQWMDYDEIEGKFFTTGGNST